MILVYTQGWELLYNFLYLISPFFYFFRLPSCLIRPTDSSSPFLSLISARVTFTRIKFKLFSMAHKSVTLVSLPALPWVPHFNNKILQIPWSDLLFHTSRLLLKLYPLSGILTHQEFVWRTIFRAASTTCSVSLPTENLQWFFAHAHLQCPWASLLHSHLMFKILEMPVFWVTVSHTSCFFVDQTFS